MLACMLYRTFEISPQILNGETVQTYLNNLKQKFLLCPAQTVLH